MDLNQNNISSNSLSYLKEMNNRYQEESYKQDIQLFDADKKIYSVTTSKDTNSLSNKVKLLEIESHIFTKYFLNKAEKIKFYLKHAF